MDTQNRTATILQIIWENPGIKVSGIQKLVPDTSLSSINRSLKALVLENKLLIIGAGRNTAYQVTSGYKYIYQQIGDSYFNKDFDERVGNKTINRNLFSELAELSIFSSIEFKKLNQLQSTYEMNISTLSEGNTYSLLETEVLLKQHFEAEGKSKADALMLLNHKTALDYLFAHRIHIDPLQVSSIENIHSVLTQALGVSRNIRKRIVGITGTSYTPPDNQYQIMEFLEQTCELINKRETVFEKAMLAVLLISYIQPFEDGNKRTGRITGNGLLIEYGYCPLSYRSIKPIDYKKAMILFYEQNNMTAYKQIFMDQYEYAVNNYYR